MWDQPHIIGIYYIAEASYPQLVILKAQAVNNIVPIFQKLTVCYGAQTVRLVSPAPADHAEVPCRWLHDEYSI